MSNFELIDDYLTNRLSEQDRKSFEQQLASDPTLKADLSRQEEIIQGLKAARAAELKGMLNKVPITTPTIYLSPLRVAAGLIGTAVIATAIYLYIDNKDNLNPGQLSSSFADSIRQTEQKGVEIKLDSASNKDELNEINSIQPIDKKENAVETKKETTPSAADNTKQENKPVIDLVDPTEDLTENTSSPAKSGVNNSTIAIAKIDVDVISSERKFKSHYQFANGRLVLYGNFDSGLYEIIEVNAQHSRSLFLYYKASYYLLDEAKREVTVLKEISDPVLIQKLKTFRSN